MTEQFSKLVDAFRDAVLETDRELAFLGPMVIVESARERLYEHRTTEQAARLALESAFAEQRKALEEQQNLYCGEYCGLTHTERCGELQVMLGKATP